jgi:hypothetical protein
MSWDALFRCVRVLLLVGGGALVACRYGWEAVVLCALAVGLHGIEVLASRAKHDAEVKALRTEVDALTETTKKHARLLEMQAVAARKPQF